MLQLSRSRRSSHIRSYRRSVVLVICNSDSMAYRSFIGLNGHGYLSSLCICHLNVHVFFNKFEIFCRYIRCKLMCQNVIYETCCVAQ